MKLNDWFDKIKLLNRNQSRRANERAYYEKTQRQLKPKKRRLDKQRREAEYEWWRIVTWTIVVGVPLLIILLLQFTFMSINNLGVNTEKVGLFVAFGQWRVYFLICLIGLPIFYWYVKKKIYGIWYHNNALWLQGEIEEYENDAYIRTIDHLTNELDVAPDAGLGFDGHVSTIVGHMMVSNKGIKKVKMPKYDATVDGYVKRDSQGNIEYEVLPMFDEALGHKLYSMSNVPQELRHFYDATLYDFNPLLPAKEGGDGKKRKGGYGRMEYDKLSDVINQTFYPLDTHSVRPAGVYFYDSRPVNTILIAITRGGKGQTYIEPAFDVWSREKKKWNLFTTDPKGNSPRVSGNWHMLCFNCFETLKLFLLQTMTGNGVC